MTSRSARLAEILALILILAAAAWLRLSATHFIASDELRWLCRSSNFHRALVTGHWDETFQVGHPGVVTMWLGTLALPRETIGAWWDRFPNTDGCTDLTKFDDVGQEGLLQTLPPLLFTARRGIQLGTVACLAALYFLLRRWHHLPAMMALTCLAFLAFDPFLLAHSQVLHVDAMVSLLSLLAVVALAAVIAGPRYVLPDAELAGEAPIQARAFPNPEVPPVLVEPGLGDTWRWPVVAGVFAGLAFLAKASALILLPFVALYLVWQGWRSRDWWWVVRTGLLWAAGATAVFVMLWPAMWGHPIQTVLNVLAKVGEEGGNPHEAGNFFMGRAVEDPGWAFYLEVIHVRYSRMVMIFVTAVVPSLAVLGSPERHEIVEDGRARGMAPLNWSRLTVVLCIWMLLFGLVMTWEPKKFDRYLLPALVAFLVGTGIQISATLSRAIAYLAQRFEELLAHPERWRDKLFAGVFIVVWSGLFTLAVSNLFVNSDVRRYPLASYDRPMAWFGRPVPHDERIENRVLVGWGEGYDLAANYLNGLPDAEHMEVTVRGVSNFAPLFKGRTRSADGYRPGTSDFVVFYISQVQRRQNSDLLAAYVDKPAPGPNFTGTINGIDYVWVYRNVTLEPIRTEIFRRAGPADVIVAGGETAFARNVAAKQPLVRYWGHWQAAEMQESLAKDFPADWKVAWVVRYPGFDPPVALDELTKVARRGETIPLADGVVELTRFERIATGR